MVVANLMFHYSDSYSYTSLPVPLSMSLATVTFASLLVVTVLAKGSTTHDAYGSEEVETVNEVERFGTINLPNSVAYDLITSETTEGEDVTCPNWLFPIHNSTACKCGSDLGGVVKCSHHTQRVRVLKCYCMTYSSHNTSLIVGRCLYGCQLARSKDDPYYNLPANVSDVCDHFRRDGQLCGKCKDGFAPPVYSYDINCVNCTKYSNNWAKYVSIVFLPPTVFFLVVVIFRVSATSGQLNVFVLVCQVMSLPIVISSIVVIPNRDLDLLYRIGISLYGIWNLDFFRLLYSPFCLHPTMTTMQALALDYAIAVYPLFLIVITYLLVEMHDHNFRIFVWLWKPFHSCFAHFRREWNIRGSLINAFATFLLLSYVKFQSTSFTFLLPVRVYNIHGKALSKLYLYYDGTVEYFGKEHLPFAILALVVLLLFNIFPMLLLVVYPCRCFQKCLNHYNIRCQALHTFIDVFQGCYKDGSNGTRDCRWFAALYFMIRFAGLVIYASISTEFAIAPTTLLFLVPVFLTAVFHPHKYHFYNFTDIFLLLVLMSIGISLLSIDVANYKAVRSANASHALTIISSSIPFLYFITIILYNVFAQKRFVQNACRKLYLILPCNCREADPNFEESLPWPDRIVNAEHYEPLLSAESIEHQTTLSDTVDGEPDSYVTY